MMTVRNVTDSSPYLYLLTVSQCPVRALTFECLDLETTFFCTSSESLGKFICQGHQIKLKVTRAKKRDLQLLRMVSLRVECKLVSFRFQKLPVKYLCVYGHD